MKQGWRREPLHIASGRFSFAKSITLPQTLDLEPEDLEMALATNGTFEP